MVSIRRTDLCAFERLPGARVACAGGIVSIRRTDLCAFELSQALTTYQAGTVSIRRTDLCAFEPNTRLSISTRCLPFQSVERICVPSNGCRAEYHRAHPTQVSIRRTDLCAFERRRTNGRALLGEVSIRRTDLCAFERCARRWMRPIRSSFNPSNGFVCLRTLITSSSSPVLPNVSIRRTDLCAFEPQSR